MAVVDSLQDLPTDPLHTLLLHTAYVRRDSSLSICTSVSASVTIYDDIVITVCSQTWAAVWVSHSPSLVGLQLVQESVVAVFEHQVHPLPPPEHLQKVDQVAVTQFLQKTIVSARIAHSLARYYAKVAEACLCGLP